MGIKNTSLISYMNSNELSYKKKDLKFNQDNKLKSIASHINYELYGKVQYIKYNTLLMGMPYYDESIYVIEKSKVNKQVYDLGGKITFSYFPNQRKANKTRFNTVYFEIVYRSKEFDLGESHVFGNVGITVLNL